MWSTTTLTLFLAPHSGQYFLSNHSSKAGTTCVHCPILSVSHLARTERTVMFAGLSGDYNVLHTDAEFMKTTIFGERIAHGLLCLAIQSGLFSRATAPYATLAFGGLRWKFKAPVKIGDTIRLRAKVVEKKDLEKPDRGVVTLDRTILNQHDEVVQQDQH